MNRFLLLSLALLLSGCASQRLDVTQQALQDLTQRVSEMERQNAQFQEQLATLSEYSRLPTGVSAVPINRNSGAVMTQQSNSQGGSGLYEQALNLYRAGDINSAIPLFKRFVAENPNNSQVPMAQYWLGDAYYNQRNYEMANRYLGIFLKNMPNSDKTQAALKKLIYSLRAVGRDSDADILSQQGVSAISD